MHKVEKTNHNIDKHWLEQNNPAYKAELSDFNMQVSENVKGINKNNINKGLKKIALSD